MALMTSRSADASQFTGPVVSKEQASIFLQAMYPGCPPRSRRKILKRMQRKVYRGRVAQVVGLVVDVWVRHQRTYYDRLRWAPPSRALSRAEARKAVAAEVAAIVAGFRVGSAETDPEYQQIRADFGARRQVEGEHTDLVAEQNAAVTDRLLRWLVRRRSQVRDDAIGL